MKKIINLILCLLITICISGCGNKEETEVINDETSEEVSPYRLNNDGNVEEFDLAFLKFENKEGNKIYSPLSIKYALAMLNEGADGDSKAQLEAILNGYTPNKYTNSENLSLANLFVIRNTLTDNVSSEFKETLKDKYDADLMIDTFENPNIVNNWISEKTFDLIKGPIDNYPPDLLFLVVNALAIDMEWIKKIQPDTGPYIFSTHHENYSYGIDMYGVDDPPKYNFNGVISKGTKFVAIANKYDIIKEVGEETIRKVVKEDLIKTISENEYTLSDLSSFYGGSSQDEIINNFLDQYIEEISQNYGDYDESTDFYFYDDENIKVFAKDLKEYDGTQFEYIGIMPKEDDLTTYIENLSSQDLDTIINNLVDPSFDYFEEGYITEVVGTIPTFKFTYDLNLNDDLRQIGITDLFDVEKADLTKIIGDNSVYIDTKHKSTIEFSNDGIKAAAVTIVGGIGGAGVYDYYYEVPVKTINITFDKPFLFLIRNKDTNDIWFIGTVYDGEIATINNLYVQADAIKIRDNPSLSGNKIGSAKKGDSYNVTGNIVTADGYTWYELSQGGWIADDNGEWVYVY